MGRGKQFVLFMTKRLLDYKFFVFDFDGVIADTVQIKTQAFAKLYRPYGEPVVSLVTAHHATHGGIDRFKKIKFYHREYLKQKLSSQKVNELAEKFASLVLKKVIKADFIKGTLKFLKLLKDKKKSIFVISATPKREIKEIIKRKGIGKFFREIKGAPPEKEKNLKIILKKHKFIPSDCVYFGDAQEDLKSAAACGVTFIPLNYFDRKKGYKDFIELMEDKDV